MRDCAVIYDVTDKEKLMLSAVKNFAITLIVSLLVFGTIAFFVAPAIEQGMTMGGKSTESTDDSGESKLPDGYVYVTDGVTRKINNSNYDADNMH